MDENTYKFLKGTHLKEYTTKEVNEDAKKKLKKSRKKN